MSCTYSTPEVGWSRVGKGLNTINTFFQAFLHTQLKTLHQSLPRITDPANPFLGCLSDSYGDPLRFFPDNHPAPPGGVHHGVHFKTAGSQCTMKNCRSPHADADGLQLCYRALPHYEATLSTPTPAPLTLTQQGHITFELKRLFEHQQLCQFCAMQHRKQCPEKNCQHCETCKLLKGKSQPIPITNEHELAYLYLQEFYKKQPGCDIFSLDASAILNVISKAQCIPDHTKKQAAKVRDNVRNSWAHAIIHEWTPTKINDAFLELQTLAQMVPNSTNLMKELHEDLNGTNSLDFPKKAFLLEVDKYRTCIRNGKHKKIQEKIKRLANMQNKEIYLKRHFNDLTTGQDLTEVEDIVLEEATTLLKGEAGSGKSSVAAKAMMRWAEGHHMKNMTCCLFLAAGSEEKIPLYKIVWDEYNSVQRRSKNEAEEAFEHLQSLADEGKLAIIIDGLDELGDIKQKDVKTACRAASHPPLEIDMKTACVGILNKTILPGAKVLATGRNTELINTEFLDGKASMKRLVDLTQSDRVSIVELMEPDSTERLRIQEELDRVSTAGNHYFLRTPLMTKVIVQLIIDRKVDIKKVNNSSDIYLMVLMSNLVFHTNTSTNFTELDPPEDHDYLIRCLKLCQGHIQTSIHDSSYSNTIQGIQRNVAKLGQCFEKKVLDETICIPVEFIKKLGIFEYRKDGGKAYLDGIHLSFLEFCCAGSLCRKNVDVLDELSKISDESRYEAVVIYLAGLFTAENTSIAFLNTCKDLCQNFLDLLDNQEREKSVQDAFKSVMDYPLKKNQVMLTVYVTTDEVVKGKKKKRKITREIQISGQHKVDVLVKAMTASGAKLSNMRLTKVSLPLVNKWRDFQCVADLVELQQHEIEYLEVSKMSVVDEEDDITSMIQLLRVSKRWIIKNEVFPNSSMTIEGQRMDSIDHGSFKNCSVVLVLYGLLRSVKVWRLDSISMFTASQADWTALASEAKNGQICTVEVSWQALKAASQADIAHIWNSLDKEWLLIYDDGNDIAIRKTEGDDGLQKLLSLHTSITVSNEDVTVTKEVIMIDCN